MSLTQRLLSRRNRNQYSESDVRYEPDPDCDLAADQIRRLREALRGLVERHAELVNCGDCGHWDVEKEPAMMQARRVLETTG